MTNFDKLVAAAKTSQRDNCNNNKTDLAGGYAENGQFKVCVSPVRGRISHLKTVKISCYISDKPVSKTRMQEAMA